MSEQHQAPQSEGPVSGQAARRKFLKRSGTIAVAAPAAALLLSATSANAQTRPPYTVLDNLDDN